MTWTWRALLECGHRLGDFVSRGKAFTTPVEPGDKVMCEVCGRPVRVKRTEGRG